MARDREHAAPTRPAEPAPARPAAHATNPVLALQQTAGNRAVGRVLAREASGKTPPKVKIGSSTIVVAGGNIDAWAAGEVPEALSVTSETGRHSKELEQLSKDGKRIGSLTLTVPAPGQEGAQVDLGSLAIEITNGRVQGYAVDGSTESWKVIKFDGVHRTKTKHTVGES